MFKKEERNNDLEAKLEIIFSLNTNKFLPRCLKTEIKDLMLISSKYDKVEVIFFNHNKIMIKIMARKITDIYEYIDYNHIMIEIPVFLYDIKNNLFHIFKSDIKDVLVAMQISDSVFLHIYGKNEMVKNARIEVYRILCNLLKIKNYYVDRKIAKNINENDIYFIYDSYINTKKALIMVVNENLASTEKYLASNNTNHINSLDTIYEKKFKEEYNFDTLMFLYCLYYYRTEIEDILSFNKCNIYLNKNKKVVLSGNNLLQFKCCFKEICSIYFNIIYCEITFEPTITNNVFIFKSESKYIIIGTYEKITEIMCLDKTKSKISFSANKEYEEIFRNPKGQNKLQKILKETGVTIKTNVKDEWIDFEMTGPSNKIVKTMYLLNQERPTEINFFVEEKDHKKLIGHGGKNIQKYMKKHSVYIKFMNEPERISLGYSGNVIIKTPLRNANSLLKMKDEILGITTEKNDVCIISILELYGLKTKNYKTLQDYIVLFNNNQKIKYYEIDSTKGYNLNLILENPENVLLKVSGSEKVFMKSWYDYDLKKVIVDDWIHSTNEDSKKAAVTSTNDLLLFSEEYDVIGQNIEELIQKYDLEE